MTKAELIKNISEISAEEVSQKQVNAVLIALEEIVKDSVYWGHEAIIPGICKIKSEHMKVSIKIVSSLKNIFK